MQAHQPQQSNAISQHTVSPLDVAIITELLSAGFDVRLPVTGASMRPALRTGDFARVTPCDGISLRRGDIIVQFCQDTIKVHRVLVLNKRTNTIQTRGDGSGGLVETMPRSAAIGRVTAIERDGTLYTLGWLSRRSGLVRARIRSVHRCITDNTRPHHGEP